MQQCEISVPTKEQKYIYLCINPIFRLSGPWKVSIKNININNEWILKKKKKLLKANCTMANLKEKTFRRKLRSFYSPPLVREDNNPSLQLKWEIRTSSSCQDCWNKNGSVYNSLKKFKWVDHSYLVLLILLIIWWCVS